MKKIIGLFIAFIFLCGALSEQDKALFAPGRNILTNGGFELGTAGWVLVGGTSSIVKGASAAYGNMALAWTASGGSTATATITIPPGMYGRTGIASCLIKTNTGSATHTIGAIANGATTLTSIAIGQSTGFIRSSTSTFTIPTYGTLALQLTAVAKPEPEIFIDDCYLGPSDAFTALTTIGPRSEVWVQVDGGNGGTNTAIRYYSTVVKNVGTDITYTSSSTNGDSFTANTDGLYAISMADSGTNEVNQGVSLNSNQLTTSIVSITASNVVCQFVSPTANLSGSCSVLLHLNIGDVLRNHHDGNTKGTNAYGQYFRITKVSN